MAKKDLYLLLFIVLGLCGIGLISCEKDEPECYQPVNVTAINAFVIRDSIRRYDTLPSSTPGNVIVRDTYYISFRDSQLINPGMYTLDVTPAYRIVGDERESVLPTPLNPNKDSMRYLILFDTAVSGSADTLTFFYTSSVHFISNNCGYTNYFYIDSVHVTKHVLDSAAIFKREVTSDQSTRNILLYFL
jgi:hypothetical protein